MRHCRRISSSTRWEIFTAGSICSKCCSARIEADARSSHAGRRTLVFLGDYVDRGPDSKGVVERLIGGLPQGFEAHFLKGNHEAILLNFLDDAWSLDNWLLNGGDATMRSYGLDTDRLARLERAHRTVAPSAARGAAQTASALLSRFEVLAWRSAIICSCMRA